MARVLIAGCGYVGAALGGSLARRGDTVFGLRRRAALVPPELQPIAADLALAPTLSALPSRLDAVVFAAAPAGGGEDAYRRVYLQGLANLLEALASRPAAANDAGPRVILLSSTSVYGQTGGEWVDESSPTEPADYRGRLVLDGEARLRCSGLSGVALRLGGIYGPGRTGLIDSVRAGRARIDPGPPRFSNRIHRDDAAAAVVHLLAAGPAAAAAGDVSIFIGVDEEPADRAEVLRWLATRLGVAPPSPPEDGAEQAARPPGGRAETSKRCSSAKLRATGFRFKFPTFREGYEDLLPIASVESL